MAGVDEAKAAEREERENLRAIIEASIASFPARFQDKARQAFRPALDRIAAADARDDAVAAEVLDSVTVV